MRQVITVQFKLLLNPLFPGHLTLQLDIEDAGPVICNLQKVELLADMLDHIGKIKAVQETWPVPLAAVLGKIPSNHICERPQRSSLMLTDTLGILPAGKSPAEHGHSSGVMSSG